MNLNNFQWNIVHFCSIKLIGSHNNPLRYKNLFFRKYIEKYLINLLVKADFTGFRIQHLVMI